MADHGDHREEFHDDHPHAFDVSEPKYGIVAIFGIATVVVLVVVVLAIQFYFETFKEQQVYVQVLAPEGEQLKDLRNKEDQQLHSFGYTDREKGAVRIPIDRAMQLLAAEASENRLKYPTQDQRVKTQAEILAAGPDASAKPGPPQDRAMTPGNTAATNPPAPGASLPNRKPDVRQ